MKEVQENNLYATIQCFISLYKSGFLIPIKALYLKCLHDTRFTGWRLSDITIDVTPVALLHNDPHSTAHLFSSAYVIKCHSQVGKEQSLLNTETLHDISFLGLGEKVPI